MMRVHGTLRKWNDARGFGFVARDARDEEIFVHVSAFPQDGTRPRIGETLSFEIVDAADGKRFALHVQRPGRAQRGPSLPPRAVHRRSLSLRGVAPIVALAALVVFAYQHVETAPGAPQMILEQRARTGLDKHPASAQAEATLRCDGRTRCTQMSSCAEAIWFLQHCPNVQMDGNHDGMPCEQQWCTQ